MVPLKDVEVEPWYETAVDLAGPWSATIDGKQVSFWSLTCIDTFTGFVEIIPIYNKKMETISEAFIREWLRRYPRPHRVIFDKGSEFDCEAFATTLVLWHLKLKPITVKNPRANAIVERMHSTLGNMLRCQLVKKHSTEDPIKDMLSAAAYAIRSTVHTVTGFSPGQLAFGRDMLLRTKQMPDVDIIRQRRAQAITKNNAQENKRRIKFDYKEGGAVMIRPNDNDPKLKPNEGPYRIVNYDRDTGTLKIQRRGYVESINIRRVIPFFGRVPTKQL
jgi:hypothetical protein